MEYYEGGRLLSQRDSGGNKPVIYLTSSNRSSGKTTYWTRLLFRHYKETGKPFALFWRYLHELDNCAEKVFADQKALFFPLDNVTAKRNKREPFTRLYFNDEKEACGYVFALNGADGCRKFSPLFRNISEIFFDEFQSEMGAYCPQEITKFQSLYYTVARSSNGIRHVPVYMASNCVSVLNPYYTNLGIGENLREGQRFQRGVGWVCELWENKDASKSMQESAFGRAFAGSNYIKFAAQNVYLKDSQNCIARAECNTTYVCTLVYNGKSFGIRYGADGLYYCDDRFDPYCLRRYSVDRAGVSGGVVYQPVQNWHFRTAFDSGCFRFANQECKSAVFRWLSL